MRTRPDGFAKGSPFGRAVERSETERVTPGRNPFSHGPWPCQLPRRGRPWQRRKVYSLTAGFFLSLNSEDEACRFCQRLPLSGELSPQATERVTPGRNPFSHGPWPCQLPRRGRPWQGRKVYSLTAGFFLSLNGEDETCRFCQGLALRESCRAQRD